MKITLPTTLFLSLLIILGEGCTQTCSEPCGFSSVYYVAIGFSRSELIGTIRTMDHGIVDTLDSNSSKHFIYPGGDSTSDTIMFGGFQSGVPEWAKLFIPGTNQTFTITNFKIIGNLTEQVKCHEGTPSSQVVGHGCNGIPYLRSYSVNGTIVTIPQTSSPGDTAGYIYIHK